MEIKALALEITEDGEVFFQGKKCSTQRGTRGYRSLRLPAHRFIAQAVHGDPPSPKHVCHHIDGNPSNNRPDNLKWITQRENCSIRASGRPRKLTQKQVADILACKPAPRISLADMARKFGVAMTTVEHVRGGRTWKNGWHKHNRRRLTAVQIQMIKDWRPTVVTAALIARKYNVSDVTILNIWHGRY